MNWRSEMNMAVLVASALAVASVLSAGEPVRVDDAASLPQAVKALKPGDVLALAPGTYKTSIWMQSVHGTWRRPIVIRCEGKAVVQPTERDGILLSGCSYITFEGIEVRAAERAGMLVSKSHHVTIRRCVMADNGRWGIQTCLSDRITVEDCILTGSRREHGVYFSTTDRPVVRRCVIAGNGGCGVHLNGDRNEGGDGVITSARIEDNTIYGNGSRGGAAVNMDGVEQSLVLNNLVYGNLAGGIACFAQDGARAGNGNRFVRNTVWFAPGHGRYALQIVQGAQASAVSNNVLVCGRGPALEIDAKAMRTLTADRNVYRVSGASRPVAVGEDRMGLSAWQKKSGQDAESLDVDPLFADTGKGDFALRKESPARRIGAGRRPPGAQP